MRKQLIELRFKNNEGYHELVKTFIDWELRSNVSKFRVTTKEKTGSLIREYNILSSLSDEYIENLKSDPDTRIIEIKYL